MTKIAIAAAFSSLFALASCSVPADAQKSPGEEAILETVDAFFLAMAKKDADAMSTFLAPGATMVALGYGERAGPPRRSSIESFIERLREDESSAAAQEVYWRPTVLQRRDLAVVWAPYKIDVAGDRLHCGIDVFNMSQENGKWLIDSISFTMEPDACPELEPEGVAARPVFEN